MKLGGKGNNNNNNNNNNSGKLQQNSQLVLRGWETVEFHP